MKHLTEGIIDDAVVFHNELNPALWQKDGTMIPAAREALLAMANEFQEFLGLDTLDLVDITVSGSNAAYSYTPHSDIDLHLVVNIPEGMDNLYLELFDAKKNLYNVSHNQKIKGFDVEFYVQPSNTSVESIGLYSVMNGEWVLTPHRSKPTIDDLSVKSKVFAYTEIINDSLRSSDYNRAHAIWDSVKDMRKSGLAKGGEFSAENLAYKVLRTRGLTGALFDRLVELKDQELSVESVTSKR